MARFFLIFTTVTMNISVWDVTPCRLVDALTYHKNQMPQLDGRYVNHLSLHTFVVEAAGFSETSLHIYLTRYVYHLPSDGSLPPSSPLPYFLLFFQA
jgi:hypothetical protein